MNKQKTAKDRKKRMGRLRLILSAVCLLLLCGVGFGQGYDWGLLPWGLNLEELNRSFKEKYKTGQIQEDKQRTEIEFQYSPSKSVKVNKGELMALVNSTDSSSSGRLYGYAYGGKFFGRIILFKDHPELFPEAINSRLKERYPQGRVYRTYGATRSPSLFEFKSDKIYVFTTERGIFFYDPNLLEEAARKFRGQIDDRERKYEEEWRNKPVMP